jgi:hypothetical protein
MIAAVSCATCSAPRRAAGDVSGKAKEAALQQKIDTESMQRARTTCSETASKIGADIAGLKAQLAQLQRSDKSAGASSADASSATPDARYQEF